MRSLNHPFAISLSLSLAVALGLYSLPANAQQNAAAPQQDAQKAAPEKAAPVPGLHIGAMRAGGGPLSPEQLAKAYDLEAQSVARQLKLDNKKTAKLVEAYKSARENQRKAVEEKIGQGQMNRENFEAIQAIAGIERKNFETALKGFLSEEQVPQASIMLGAFNRRWDQMVTVLDGMDLKPEAKDQAMDLVAGYMKDTSQTMKAATTDADRQALREKNRARRDQLDADLGKILTPDQLTKWKEATTRQGGRH